MACQHRVDSDYCSPPLQSKIVDHSDFSDINDRPSDGDMSRKNLQQGWGGKDFTKHIPLLRWCDAPLHSSQLEASKVDSFLLDHTV